MAALWQLPYGTPWQVARPWAEQVFIGFNDSLPGVPQKQWLDAHVGGRRWSLRSNDLETMLQAAVAGLGLALLPRHGVNLELATGGLKELPVEELPLYRSWCLVQAKAKRLSPVAHAFLGFIRSERVQISALAERFAGQPRVPASAVPGSP